MAHCAASHWRCPVTSPTGVLRRVRVLRSACGDDPVRAATTGDDQRTQLSARSMYGTLSRAFGDCGDDFAAASVLVRSQYWAEGARDQDEVIDRHHRRPDRAAPLCIPVGAGACRSLHIWPPHSADSRSKVIDGGEAKQTRQAVAARSCEAASRRAMQRPSSRGSPGSMG